MNDKNVLVLGSGGREHSLAWSLTQSPQTGAVFVAPGNGGTTGLVGATNVDLDSDFASLCSWCHEQSIELVVVGPEAPLAEGVADALRASGIPCFGPSAKAARIEASKAWSKDFMVRHGIPTARHAVFKDESAALAHVETADYPVVVKASGLAAGKGVILPQSKEETRNAVHEMFAGRFGDAGEEVVIEELLTGWELSVFALCDGERLVICPPAQDHKRQLDGNRGPNTGGMGAYAPAPQVTDAILEAARTQVLEPALAGLADEGSPFIGVLYAGLMMTPNGIRNLEFNCRFGDPETQVVLPLLKSDFFELALACATGSLGDMQPEWHRNRSAVTVVAASEGYPGKGPRGLPINGVERANALDDVIVFQAGTELAGEQLVTAGGRVLASTGLGASLESARTRAYAGMSEIQFKGMQYRSDIGTAPGSGL